MPKTSEIARLFPIESQSSIRDKEFLLAAQRLMGDVAPCYDYLEIGSFLGGSLAPFSQGPSLHVDPFHRRARQDPAR